MPKVWVKDGEGGWKEQTFKGSRIKVMGMQEHFLNRNNYGCYVEDGDAGLLINGKKLRKRSPPPGEDVRLFFGRLTAGTDDIYAIKKEALEETISVSLKVATFSPRNIEFVDHSLEDRYRIFEEYFMKAQESGADVFLGVEYFFNLIGKKSAAGSKEGGTAGEPTDVCPCSVEEEKFLRNNFLRLSSEHKSILIIPGTLIFPAGTQITNVALVYLAGKIVTDLRGRDRYHKSLTLEFEQRRFPGHDWRQGGDPYYLFNFRDPKLLCMLQICVDNTVKSVKTSLSELPCLQLISSSNLKEPLVVTSNGGCCIQSDGAFGLSRCIQGGVNFLREEILAFHNISLKTVKRTIH